MITWPRVRGPARPRFATEENWDTELPFVPPNVGPMSGLGRAAFYDLNGSEGTARGVVVRKVVNGQEVFMVQVL